MVRAVKKMKIQVATSCWWLQRISLPVIRCSYSSFAIPKSDWFDVYLCKRMTTNDHHVLFSMLPWLRTIIHQRSLQWERSTWMVCIQGDRTGLAELPFWMTKKDLKCKNQRRWSASLFHLSHLSRLNLSKHLLSRITFVNIIIICHYLISFVSRFSNLQDKLSGAYWLKRAATQHLPAQLMLGEMLLKGDGVKRVLAAKERFFGCHIFFAWKDVVLSSSYIFAMR